MLACRRSGLGLDEDGTASQDAAGFVGQNAAREVRLSQYPLLPSLSLGTGLWHRGRFDQNEKVRRTRSTPRWWTRHRQNSPRSGYGSRARYQSTLLPHGWQRNLQQRSQKDRGPHGKLSQSHRSVLNSSCKR